MADSAGSSVSVTLAEIARIAGVGRAAVSNWRRRHDSFPASIGGTDASPQFALSEVEKWLRAQGRFDGLESRELLWPEFEALGDRDSMGTAIAATGTRLGAESAARSLLDGVRLSKGQRSLAAKAVRLAARDGAYETFGFLLRRWLDTHVRQISATPTPLAELMVELAELSREGASGGVRTVLDPACGTGELLLAAGRRWGGAAERHGSDLSLRLLGQDIDPVLAALAEVHLSLAALSGRSPERRSPAVDGEVDIRPGDTLRADLHPDIRADVVLCVPPFNERDWGHEELATDLRWTYGLPPRTEPELAWVQHCLARLAPGGTAVILLPPAVASRKAGRRIRATLLRTGVLQAVVSLPPGCAQPHGLSLHMWVLRALSDDQRAKPVTDLLLVDAASIFQPDRMQATKAEIDWKIVHEYVLSAVQANGDTRPKRTDRPLGDVSVPVIDLLDDEVDLTPARHVPTMAGGSAQSSWSQFGALLQELQELTSTVSQLGLGIEDRATQDTMTVGDLLRAGALTLRAGRQLPDGQLRSGDAPFSAVAVLTLADVLQDGVSAGWLPAAEAVAGQAAETLTVTAPGEVVVVGVARAFGAWVDTRAPTVLGPQLYALRGDPTLLDPWFLAGCLRAPANARRAGTHVSASSRIDVRRLQIPRLPLDEQRRYGEAFRRLLAFEGLLRKLGGVGEALVHELSDGLAAGKLPQD